MSDRLGAAQLLAERSEAENVALRAKVELLIREAEAARTEAVRLTQGLSAGQAAKSWKGLAPLRKAARQTIVERYDLQRHCLPAQIDFVTGA